MATNPNLKIDPSVEHPAHEAGEARVEMVYDAFYGKVRSEDYVAPLDGQSAAEYEAYVNRAPYLNATERTLQSVIGVMTRNPYTVTGGTDADINVTNSLGLPGFLQDVIMDLNMSARILMVVDINDAGEPYLAYYPYDQIINWGDNFIMLEVEELVPDAQNPYQHVEVERWKELFIASPDTNPLDVGLEPGAYYARYWDLDGKVYKHSEPVPMVVRGQLLRELPVRWVTPYDNTDIIYAPPLSTVANLNVAHFRLNCDLYHGLHFLGLPTFYISGDMAVDSNGNPVGEVKIGSTKEALRLAETGRAGYAEFTGTGLSQIREEKKAIEEQMAAYGARLIAPKTGVETAEALNIRVASETSVLETMSNAIENALNDLLVIYSEVKGGPTLSIELSTDFTAPPAVQPAAPVAQA